MDHSIALLLLIVSFNCVYGQSQQPSSLYDPSNDKILTLDWTNFTSTIQFQPNGFVVQFYKHWCPYCKRFVPIWKQLADDIKKWRPIVKLAVINCAYEENVGTCRAAAIPFVPTIHFYPSYWNFSSGLTPIVIKKGTVDALRGNITTLINSTSSTFSDLFNYTDPVDLRNLTQSIDQKIFLIGDRRDSKIGIEVILDNYQHRDEVIIKRVNWQSPWFNQLQFNESQLPIIVTLPKRGFLPIPVAMNQSTKNSRRTINEIIEKSIGLSSNQTDINGTELNVTAIRSIPSNISTFNGSTDGTVYVDDLYKCLQQILTNEILIYDHYTLEKLNSLKNFTKIVGQYFPFTNLSNGKTFFSDLSESIQSYETRLSNNSMDGIPVTRLIETINQLQRVHHLPKPINWITCRGSNPIYRGYTCSLWLLWHTLSVGEYLQVGGQLMDHQVAFTMRSFIRDFFSCEECRQHFINETSNIINDINQTDPFSSIRYLWSVHNSVNKRIAGDPTEDPYFPKIQFPSSKQCSSCWSRGQFNDLQVLQFLINRYKPSNWIPYETTERPKTISKRRSLPYRLRKIL